MLTQEQGAQLLTDGHLEEIITAVKAYKVVPGHEAHFAQGGRENNIFHRCEACGKFYDEFIRLRDVDSICEDCAHMAKRGKAVVNIGSFLQDTIAETLQTVLEETKPDKIIAAKIQEIMLKAAKKATDKISNI